MKTPYGPVQVSSSPTLMPLPLASRPGEVAALVELDHELQAVRPPGVLAIENDRCSPSAPGIAMSMYWPALEREPLRLAQLEAEAPDVVGERLDGLDLARSPSTIGDAAAQDLLVVVDELDLDVGQRVRPAQQRVALRLLEVGQRERRVAIEVDLAVEQERLAGRALPLLAAVHEHDPLPEGGVEDRLVLVDLELDADRLEPRDVLLAHGACVGEPARRCRLPRLGGSGRRRRAGRRGRRPCTGRRAPRAPRATSRSAARSGC